MSDELLNETLGHLLSVEDWLQALRSRTELNYYSQNGQYNDDAQYASASQRDASNAGQHSQDSASTDVPADAENTNSASDITVDTSNGVLYDEYNNVSKAYSQNSPPMNGATPPCNHRKPWSKKKQKIEEPVKDSTEFSSEFFGSDDKLHIHYHWYRLNPEILSDARSRGLEPTTLGHVLSRRGRLWAQTQCIDSTARMDFENHLLLYQKQFEKYSKSGDGWVSITTDHKVDPLFMKKGGYLKGVQDVPKVMVNDTSIAVDEDDEDMYEDGRKRRGTCRKHGVEGIYDWNNVIYCPNFGDSGEFIRRYARKSFKMYRNLYDCLVHGWVHPGLVVCEVKDATHPIRFSTPPEQDCYTVVYAGPAIPENSTQRVIFGEYTGIVYREESVEESVFEYAFELNFSSASWINADIELTKDTAEISEKNGTVFLPNNARFVLDSSVACNELSLVNHYQSVKAYGGEMWITPNCEWQQVFLDGWPHVVLTSKLGVAINPGDELVADFGGLWFSKVEETAHKQIRNELIEYRLGLRQPAVMVEQCEVPKRPLSHLDRHLTSNSSSNAHEICAICYNCYDDPIELSSDDMMESVACDGCDRFFHIHCISEISRASAVYVSKEVFGDRWTPLDVRKNVVGGSSVFYCSFCRHLAKKIYMHDMGCDYMPLSRNTYRSPSKLKSIKPLKFKGTNKDSKGDQGNGVLNNLYNSKSTQSSGVEMDLHMEIEGVCTVNIAKAKDSVALPIKALPLMKTTNVASLFELEVCKHRESIKTCNPSFFTDLTETQPQTMANPIKSSHNGQHNDHDKAAINRETNGKPPVSPVKFLQDYCPMCLRDYGNSSVKHKTMAETNECDSTSILNSTDVKTGNDRISSKDDKNHLRMIDKPNKVPDQVTNHTSIRNSSNPPPGNSSYKPTNGNCPTVSKLNHFNQEKHISTVNIGHAADMFMSKQKHIALNPRFLPPDPSVVTKSSNDATLVDYLGCKYLAGMWQLEPFALFGDCVRVCTECYRLHGPKANVYICRLLKRHLSGNFDHPMNATPAQMRELVLMAYEQHVQMLLRLLVLKNVAITFMCKLCCHFIGRQLLQNQTVIAPLPFSRDFLGKSAGPPEGILERPWELLNKSNCNAKRIKVEHQRGLQSHLEAYVLAIKNAVSSVPISSKSEPTLNYEMLNSMGALSDEFSRLANCKGIVEYLNDFMSHKVLETENTPSQLQETLTKEELKRFATFRHLIERSPGAFSSTTPLIPSKIKTKSKSGIFIPLMGIVPGVSYLYRKFTDGYYNGLITKFIDDPSPSKCCFLVTYSDGDGERMTGEDLLAQIIKNLENMGEIVANLSTNDTRNKDLLIRIHINEDKRAGATAERVRRDMLKSLSYHRAPDSKKSDALRKGYKAKKESVSEEITEPVAPKRKLSPTVEAPAVVE